jgi:hypothetical protein
MGLSRGFYLLSRLRRYHHLKLLAVQGSSGDARRPWLVSCGRAAQ